MTFRIFFLLKNGGWISTLSTPPVSAPVPWHVRRRKSFSWWSVPSRKILLLHCTVRDVDKQLPDCYSWLLHRHVGVAENVFLDDQCLLVVFFCFIVLSKMPINNSQVVIAACFIRMFVAENLFPNDQWLLVEFFCFTVLSEMLTNNSHVVIAGCYLRGGSRISKGGVDGRPYLLRGGRENALTKKIGNNFSCTCLRRVF